MANTKGRKTRFTPTRLSLSVALAMAAAGSMPAHAFVIGTDNPDVQMRWDNSVRYNAGWRMEERNPHFYNNPGTDETEGKFGKGDMVTNRFDLLSEFDFAYKNDYGFRVSGALWSENAYGDGPKRNPALVSANYGFGPGVAVPISNSGVGGSYSRYTKRYLTGSSGEFLDAFVFGSFDIGDTTLRIKAGQHNLYWGEALFTIADGVAAGQGPIDTVKAGTSPGAEAKELFMPIEQISAQWTLSQNVSLQAYYQTDWKPFRLASGGTYFASSDGGGNPYGSDPRCASTTVGGGCINSLTAITPGDSGGDYGIAARLTPNWMGEGTLGLYYRKYDEKLPWSSLQYAGGAFAPPNLGIRLSYARDTELWGISMTQPFAGFSVGMELSQRHNTALATKAGFVIGTNNGGAPGSVVLPLASTPTYDQVEGARGDTTHLVINGIKLMPKTAFFDGGVFLAELAYQHLDKVTKHNAVYYAEGHPGCVGLNKGDGCATKDSFALNLGFTPEWPQVFPSWDLKMPTSFAYGLAGNSPTLGGSYEGSYKWSIGLKATYQSRYEFGLAYNDAYVAYKTTASSLANGGLPGARVISTSAGSSSTAGIVNDHGWLNFTFKASF